MGENGWGKGGIREFATLGWRGCMIWGWGLVVEVAIWVAVGIMGGLEWGGFGRNGRLEDGEWGLGWEW